MQRKVIKLAEKPRSQQKCKITNRRRLGKQKMWKDDLNNDD